VLPLSRRAPTTVRAVRTDKLGQLRPCKSLSLSLFKYASIIAMLGIYFYLYFYLVLIVTLTTRVEIDVANNAELRANAQHVLTPTRAARPKNTSLAYIPKQREFKVSKASRLV
jgi:hypothetical protein